MDQYKQGRSILSFSFVNKNLFSERCQLKPELCEEGVCASMQVGVSGNGLNHMALRQLDAFFCFVAQPPRPPF